MTGIDSYINQSIARILARIHSLILVEFVAMKKVCTYMLVGMSLFLKLCAIFLRNTCCHSNCSYVCTAIKASVASSEIQML